MRTLIITIIITAACFTNVADAKHYKVYLLTGQSNSLGTTADKKDPDAHTPPDDQADKDILFFWSNRSTRAADGPAAVIGDSGGKITSLQKQQGEGANKSFWGPEIAFARKLHHTGERDFLIIKASRGGGGNGLWLKGGQMYQHVISTVNRATKQLQAKGHTFEVVCMLYLQGESNSTAEAKVAGERLGTFVDQLKGHLPHAKSMVTVIGGIAAAGKNRDITRQQQIALAKHRTDISYFSNLHLTEHLYDKLHFNRTAKLIIGEQFFTTYRKMKNPTRK